MPGTLTIWGGRSPPLPECLAGSRFTLSRREENGLKADHPEEAPDCAGTSPFSRRNSCLGMANSAWPQCKQTSKVGNTQTGSSSTPCCPGKWMAISEGNLLYASDPHDLQDMSCPLRPVHRGRGAGFQAEIGANLPLRNFSPRKTAAKPSNSSTLIADLRTYPQAPFLRADCTTSGSSLADTKTTFDLEAATDIRRAASMPFSFGKPISSRIKSGWQRRAF